MRKEEVLVRICRDRQQWTSKLWSCIRGGFRVQYNRLIIIMSSALAASWQVEIKEAYGAISKTGSKSQRQIVAL